MKIKMTKNSCRLIFFLVVCGLFVYVNKIEAVTFNWSIGATAEESISRSGTKEGSDGGTKETGTYKFVVIGMPDQPVASGVYYATEKRWVIVNIDYGVTFNSIPEPTVSWPTHFINDRGWLVTGGGLEVYDKTKSGCKVRVWVYYKIYNVAGQYVTNWLYAPWDHVFSWSVTGAQSLSHSASGTRAKVSGLTNDTNSNKIATCREN